MLRPMLATPGDRVPVGDQWRHEVKWDGVRLLADVTAARLRLSTRNGNDATAGYPELAGLVGRDLLLDGELVVLIDGRPSFAALQHRMHARDPRRVAVLARRHPAHFLVFDLLRLDGRELVDEPWHRRRALLEELDLAGVHVPDVYEDGATLLAATAEQGLEGVVSKRVEARYQSGVRSRDWLKFAHRRRETFVVGGWRPEVGSADRLGALLVGEPTPDGLRYRGRVGSGLSGRAARQLRELMLPGPASPFADEVPTADASGARWVQPLLYVDVEALGRSANGRLRQPSYVGLRSDLPDRGRGSE
ncbi:non-homologous end-joining DNA ligase [Nocardioides limicola]|uniref:non-homologous end-joining DNA ligase n=1 Tax=Nocardioides limicola TaxID=2803368 RepID=UPI001EEF8984|nr:non-homologous end-joining DNA ligase [Nocardioides sp. DJM-14]